MPKRKQNVAQVLNKLAQLKATFCQNIQLLYPIGGTILLKRSVATASQEKIFLGRTSNHKNKNRLRFVKGVGSSRKNEQSLEEKDHRAEGGVIFSAKTSDLKKKKRLSIVVIFPKNTR